MSYNSLTDREIEASRKAMFNAVLTGKTATLRYFEQLKDAKNIDDKKEDKKK